METKLRENMEAKLRKYVEENITFEIECLPEHMHPEGMAICSGDEDYDRQVVAKILEDLENGNEWSWCVVKVSGSVNGVSSEEYLGGCSYESQESFENDLYCEDMKSSVIDEITKELLENYETVKNTIE